MVERCVGEPGGAWPAVGCQDRSSTCTHWCMAGDRRGRRRVKEEERERKKAWLARDLGSGGSGGGDTIWAGQSLAGRPPVLSILAHPLFSLLALSLSLWVSLESRNHLKVKHKCKWFLGQRGLFYSQSLRFSRKLYFTCAPKHVAGCKIFSGNYLHLKQTQPNCHWFYSNQRIFLIQI